MAGMDIEDVRRLTVRPGETLVFRVSPGQNTQELAERLKEKVPDGVNVIVVSKDVEISVITTEE